MVDEVTSTIKTTSDGMVKISLEAYNEMVAKAAEKPPVINRTVQRIVNEVVKTPEVAAADNIAWGATLMGAGGSILIIGGIRLFVGLNQAKKLKIKL